MLVFVKNVWRRGFESFVEMLESEKPSRNAPCSCGSGKKYKKCCMKQEC